MEVSAKDGTNITKLFEEISLRLLEFHDNKYGRKNTNPCWDDGGGLYYDNNMYQQ